MWFNEKNAIKKLARNLKDYMNVITIETVKHYGTIKVIYVLDHGKAASYAILDRCKYAFCTQ